MLDEGIISLLDAEGPVCVDPLVRIVRGRRKDASAKNDAFW
jgi:hypothetical protein